MGVVSVRICPMTACGHQRILIRPNQRWCSATCRKKNYRERMKRLLKAAHPARLIERRELAMALARDRLKRLLTDLDRHMTTGSNVPFDRETKLAISQVLSLLQV